MFHKEFQLLNKTLEEVKGGKLIFNQMKLSNRLLIIMEIKDLK